MLQANSEQLQGSRKAEREAEEKHWQAKQQNKESKRINEKAKKEAELKRMLALQREYLEEKARTLLAEQQLAAQEQKIKTWKHGKLGRVTDREYTGRDCHSNPEYDCRGHPYICLSFFC